MNKVFFKARVGMLLCIIASAMVISCNKQDKNIDSKSDNESSASIGPDFYPEVIMAPNIDKYGRFSKPLLYLAFKNNKGEYIVFDNDADYTSLCIDAKIVGSIARKYPFDFDQMTKGKQNMAEEIWNDSIVPWLKPIAGYVRQYYYGNKSLIPEDIFEIIDRYHYNEHPLQSNFTFSSSRYNEKSYRAPLTFPDGYYQCITFTPSNEIELGKYGCLTLDGNKIPANFLVCLAPFN